MTRSGRGRWVDDRVCPWWDALSYYSSPILYIANQGIEALNRLEVARKEGRKELPVSQWHVFFVEMIGTYPFEKNRVSRRDSHFDPHNRIIRAG